MSGWELHVTLQGQNRFGPIDSVTIGNATVWARGFPMWARIGDVMGQGDSPYFQNTEQGAGKMLEWLYTQPEFKRGAQ